MIAAFAETACPVCGMPGVFPMPGWYDTCSRCGWVDEPEGIKNPGVRSPANDTSFEEACATWPARAAAAAAALPLSVLSIAPTPYCPRFGDFVIDGTPLLTSIGRAVTPGRNAFGRWLDPPFALSLVEMLLLERASHMPSGRIPVYVCDECGDPMCGAFTADVTRTGDRMVWSRLGYESYAYGRPDHDEYDGWELEPSGGPVGFAFDAESYRATLLAALDALGA